MNPPANWYPDPTGRHGQRYWDGSQWTEHVFTDGVQDVDPLDVATAEDESTDADDTDRLLEEAAAAAAEGDAARTDAADLAADDAADDGEDEDTPVVGTPVDDTPVDDTPTDDPSTAAEVAQDVVTDEPLTADEPGEGDELADEPVVTSEGSGLFADAAPSDPDSGHAPDGAPWRPDDGPAAEQDVAPEVEAEDVVAAIDETTDAQGVADFSDAFVLAPETASRLVRGSEPAPSTPAPTSDDDEVADEVMPPPAADDRLSAPTDDATTTAAPAAEEPTADDPAPAPAPSGRDAPQPSQASSRLTAASLGMSGDLVSGVFAEQEDVGPVALQNSRLLRCSAAGGIVARQGTMVAYQGDVDFERQGAGGVSRAFKRAATGEGLAMMRVTGTGDVFFADGGQHVFLLQLEGGPGLSVNGRNVLAFSSSLQWDIERVKGATLLAGGLFNTTLQGSGWVALVSDGQPVVLRTDDAPTFVDVNALVAWSGGLGTNIVNTIGAKSLVGLGSGEAFQMAFEGAGIVVVQPSEGTSSAGG